MVNASMQHTSYTMQTIFVSTFIYTPPTQVCILAVFRLQRERRKQRIGFLRDLKSKVKDLLIGPTNL
jgi:hypothetical protein